MRRAPACRVCPAATARPRQNAPYSFFSGKDADREQSGAACSGHAGGDAPFSRGRGFVVLSLVLCLLLAAGCGPRAHRAGEAGRGPVPELGLPRADPAYVQWMERQSMLGMAPELASQVSGSGLIWSNSASAVRPGMLLEAAPNWLYITPTTLSSSGPVLRTLAQPGVTALMARLGLRGLYITPTGETGEIWTGRALPGGEDVTTTSFAPQVGTEEDFSRLAATLEAAGIQSGGQIPPAATGLGPDFILQARHAPRFDGLYAMMTVPKDLWPTLPTVPEEWECLPLREECVRILRDRGILPRAIVRDGLPWAEPGGWAVTGEVRGADGVPRRWVYRYSGHPLRPVLLWQDPSGQSRRIVSASIIRHTGLQGQTLAGLRFEALLGLDVPPPTPEDGEKTRLTPGPEALADATREIHRYGGWAMQADVLPLRLNAAVLAGGTDFTRDGVSAPGTWYALLSGDARPLASLVRNTATRGVDFRRLARGLEAGRGMDWRPLAEASPELVARARTLAGQRGEGFQWITMTTLAARALRLPTATEGSRRERERLRDAVELCEGVQLALPGLYFISPQTLTGALDIAGTTPSDGKVSLLGTPLLSERETAPSAFGPLEEQLADATSFAARMARLLRTRAAVRLAEGRLAAVEADGKGGYAAAVALPDGGFWLVFANFSDRPHAVGLRLPVAGRSGTAMDIHDGRPVDAGQGARELTLELQARQARHLLLGATDSAVQGGKDDR